MVVVQKYGGTSVADVERMRSVAGRIARTRAGGHGVVVVVSAMAGETNRLLGLARAVAHAPDERESDALVASGEQVTAALTALALHEAGVPARSFLGHQVRIQTDSAHGRARIVRVDVERLRAALAEGAIAGVAYDRDEAKLTVLRVPDRPGLAARVFGPIARANIVVDMIIQNASADGTTDLTFTVPRGDFDQAKGLLEATAREIGAQGVAGQLDVAKVP